MILFDFDGTLMDSARPGSSGIEALKSILKSRELYDSDLWANFPELCGLYHNAELIEKAFKVDSATAEAIFLEWNRLDILNPPVLFPGVGRVIHKITKSFGLITAIWTARSSEVLMPALRHHQILEAFVYTALDRDQVATLFCLADAGYQKPDPRSVDLALTQLSKWFRMTEEDCIIVGDSVGDIRVAIARGIEVIGVPTGMHSRQQLIDAGAKPRNIIDSIDHLEAWLLAFGHIPPRIRSFE